MNKLLKILIVLEFALILVFIGLALIDSGNPPTAFAVKEIPRQEKIDFRIYTKAVCDEKSSHIFCHDELFVNCNGNEHFVDGTNLENFTQCNMQLNLSNEKANGSAVFKKEWEDPRK
ncbi:hypothetical protein HYW20_07790 [Candidatus Woesearchaeota archaeon]|nr:hypothetical protein [Candidatus Woesearchaeota archaeon]